MRYRLKVVAGLFLLFSILHLTVAFCEEEKVVDIDTDSIEELINILRDKGIIDNEEAGRFMQRHRKREAPAPDGYEKSMITIVPEEKEKEYIEKITKDVVREIKQEVRETVKTEIKDEISEEMKAERRIPGTAEWTKRIRWGGDIRLRYQGEFYDENNALLLKPDDPTELMNTRDDRHRFRYRVRLKLKADVNEHLEFGARLVAGNEEDPVSINETLGDYFTNDDVVFDQVYLRWHPTPEMSLWGGRIPNPWFHSDLVWDPDLNFEGLALNLETALGEHWSGFLNIGGFALQEVEFSQQDKWLFGGQIGTKWEPGKHLTAKIAAAYYDYVHVEGEVNDPLRPNEKDYTAPLSQQKGNTLIDVDPSSGIKTALASDYDELNITGVLDVGFFDPVHVVLLGDYVVNLGFDKDEVAGLTGNPDVKKEIEGYQVGLTVGHPKVREFGAWNVFCFYKYLEADAVLDAFTESDFHEGGTNAQGWILGGELGLAKNWWLRTRWLSADEIEGPPLAIDVLQVDVKAEY